MELKVEGFDKVAKGLQDLRRKAEALGGENSVSLAELFPPSFMRSRTDFQTIDEMVDASDFQVESAEDLDSIPEDEWDRFVADRTEFESWKDMQGAAVEEWVASKLGF